MSKPLGNPTINPEALQQMRDRARPDTRWAAFQNMALDSASLGELRFPQIGEGCTYTKAPERYPDTLFGTGWRHLHCGFVNLQTGTIEESA